jgi:nucleoside-diphosphate-sugar epimerase
MKLSITGASGFVGRRLMDSLLLRGHDISVLTRSYDKCFPNAVRVIVGDLTKGGSPLRELLAGCDAVFHCAGEILNAATMRSVHVVGTRNLIEAAHASRRGKILHWVQLSSVGAYGQSQTPREERLITEDSPPCPVGEYEITKTEADELVMRAADAGFLSYSIVRPSKIFAAEMTNSILRSLGAMVKKGLFFYIGEPGAIATYVHVDDVVEALILCALDPRASSKVYNISNDCRLEDMIHGLASAMGVRPPRLRLPELLVRAAVAIAGGVIRTPLTQERISALVRRTRYPYLKLERELGFAPRVSVPAAIGEVLTDRPARRAS